ncbi:MAG: recombinase family protein [Candidatus Improbicoccus devescovinae]|nr:MAG: recombinase family protein [Candidatus Improbicoccus devescovinae]
MANIGYIRVSSKEQNEARQLEALKNYKIDKFFVEKKSAKNMSERPGFNEMMEYVREGDTIYIMDFSRISRSTADLLNIIDTLKAKGVSLISLKENLDTNTATGKLMITMIAAINEFERLNMLERQREGISIAKKLGKYKGRKRIEKPKNFNEIANLYFRKELTASEAMTKLNLKKNAFYNFLKCSARAS